MGALLKLSAAIDALNTAIGRVMAWCVVAAVLIAATNAIIRKAFDMSSNAWLEMQWYLFGAVFMLCSAWTLKNREHIRIDILFDQLPRRVQLWIELLGHFIFLMPFVILMIYETVPFFIRSFKQQEVSTNAGGLIIWPAKLLILVGFVLLLLQGISEIIKQIAVMRGQLPDTAHTGGHGSASHES